MGHILRTGLAASVAAALSLGAVAGLAQDKEAIVKERQATMKRQGKDFKAIQNYVRGEGDQAAAQKAIDDLLTIAPKITGLFPPGTGINQVSMKTGAKPEIWQEWDKFKAIPPTLQSEEEKLAAAIRSGDKQATGAALASTGKKGCGACHGTFREKTS